MRIARILFNNWKCFEGETDLVLDAKPYAVIAQHKSNPQRSNWLGKSSLFWAIRFVLHGEHGERTEDAWITHGMKEGAVTLFFDDGTMARRSRKRGKSTRIEYGGATQDEAEKKLALAIGLTADDFAATCYFEQRQMARLILARPEERLDVVSAWLRLAPLQRAEELLRERCSKLSTDLASKQLAVNSTDLRMREILGECKDGDELKKLRDETQKKLAQAEQAFELGQKAANANNEILQARARVTEYATIVEDGKKLKAEIATRNEKKLTDAMEKARDASQASSTSLMLLTREEEQKRKLASGRFDGHCPIAEMQCPVQKEINSERQRNAKLYEEAKERRESAARVTSQNSSLATKTAAEHGELERMKDRLLVLRQRAEVLHPAYMLAKKNRDVVIPDLQEQLIKLQNRIVDLRIRLNELDSGYVTWQSLDARLLTDMTAVSELHKQLATAREALVIFGKQGAQRRVAEGALTEIQENANVVLRECGIDLSIDIQWSREGSGLARACDACGHPFPQSARVKACERCNAARGPHLVNKLDVVLSDRSGAAEDLAGISLQLAASRWLRADRETAWSVALIDEPFGQLDEAHRRYLSAHLATMLGGRYGFTQSFVIAHHSSVLDALPGRILIESDGRRSTAKVIT